LKIPIPPDALAIASPEAVPVAATSQPRLMQQRGSTFRRVSTQKRDARAIGVLQVSHSSKLFMPFDYQSLLMFAEEVFSFLVERRMEIVLLHHARDAVRNRCAYCHPILCSACPNHT
jgi:hypothetical protein